jgi:putative nucleotidyltransferase with HDIG domain
VFSLKLTRRPFFLGLILLLFSGFVLLALLLPIAGNLSESPLSIGDVAPYEIRAPYATTYQSQVLTARQQNAAASAVSPVYSPPDTSIARRQLEHLRATLTFINSVRIDGYSTQEQKLTDLAALEDIRLSRDTAVAMLSLSESRWQSVSQETISVLEQVLRESIREDQLEEVRQRIPTLVSLSLSEEQSVIVTELVQAFVVPNTLYNEQLTEEAQQQARNSVIPVTRSFITNETIIQPGKVISDTDYEALEQYGLAQPKNRWQDIVSAAGMTLLSGAYFIFYIQRNPDLLDGNQGLRKLVLLATLFLLFLLISRVTTPGHAVVPYVYPVMAYALTVSALFSAELAVISVLPLSILTAFGLPDALALTLYYLLGSIFGVFVLKRAQRLTSFFWAGAAIAVSGAVVASVYRLTQPTADWIGITTLVAAAAINGIASASISLVLHYYLAQLLGMTTALQLIELSRPDQPLLQTLLRNAPGTYQHSLQLSNLVEQAAERIGADALLARVGALYHDVGKALNPYFVIENQPPGNLNPHNDLDPQVSAATILKHVTDGLELARKYHLPRQLHNFIAEHHGTTITRYQYGRAVEALGGDEDKVDMEKFRYPGPRPSSREIALLMLADTCEARMRAERPKDEDELRELIKSVVKDRLEIDQLNNTQLTLHDLDEIVDSFTATLRGVYHPRIQYPKVEAEVKTKPLPYKLPDDEIPSVKRTLKRSTSKQHTKHI